MRRSWLRLCCLVLLDGLQFISLLSIWVTVCNRHRCQIKPTTSHSSRRSRNNSRKKRMSNQWTAAKNGLYVLKVFKSGPGKICVRQPLKIFHFSAWGNSELTLSVDFHNIYKFKGHVPETYMVLKLIFLNSLVKPLQIFNVLKMIISFKFCTRFFKYEVEKVLLCINQGTYTRYRIWYKRPTRVIVSWYGNFL